MQEVQVTFTVFFEPPFWVGVFEKIEGKNLVVCRVVFGAEPKDYELYPFILSSYHQLSFSPTVITDIKTVKMNPKRVQREVRKLLDQHGVGTKSQQAMKLQHEENKVIRKDRNKEFRDAEKARKFDLKQEKKKTKHKGH